jgi:hypothetical protein
MKSGQTEGISELLAARGPGYWFELAVGLAVMAAAWLILSLMGRDAWCDCGRLTVWSGDIWSRHNSQHLLDPYSFTHVQHGILLCGVLWWLCGRTAWRGCFAIGLLLEMAWEVLENSSFIIERYREATISLDYYGDSVANSVMDITSCAAGYLVARKLGFRLSLAVVAVTELGLLITIRDCLALNVLMLIYPVDIIKDWQMG